MPYSSSPRFSMFEIFPARFWGAAGAFGSPRPPCPLTPSPGLPAAPRPQGWRGPRRKSPKASPRSPPAPEDPRSRFPGTRAARPGAAPRPRSPPAGPATLAWGTVAARGQTPPPGRALLTPTPAAQEPGLPGRGLRHLRARHSPGPRRGRRSGQVPRGTRSTASGGGRGLAQCPRRSLRSA